MDWIDWNIVEYVSPMPSNKNDLEAQGHLSMADKPRINIGR